MRKKIIRVQPLYTLFFWFLATCILVFMLFLGKIMHWESSEPAETLSYILFGTGIAVTVGYFIYYLQFGILDENGIVIRGLFYRIAKVNWDQVSAIYQMKRTTYDNRTNIALLWLIITVDDKKPIKTIQSMKGLAGKNRRGRPPYQIIANKRNIALIGQYHEIIKLYENME